MIASEEGHHEVAQLLSVVTFTVSIIKVSKIEQTPRRDLYHKHMMYKNAFDKQQVLSTLKKG